MDIAMDPSKLLQTALELSPTATLIADSGGEIVLVNRELERQFGYPREELVGRRIELLVPGHSGPAQSEPLDWSDTSASESGRELFARRKDGSEIAVEIRVQTIHAYDHDLLLASLVDLSDRKQEDLRPAALEDQIDFERFISDLSVQFINLPDERVTDVLRHALTRICEQLDVDRGLFYRIAPDGTLFDLVTSTLPGIQPVAPPVSFRKQFPWVLDRLLTGRPVSFATLSEVPSDVDRASFLAVGTKSAVIMPLAVEGQVVGALAFSTVQTERTWPDEVMHRLTVIASVFDQLLARRFREEAMRAATLEVQRLRDQLQIENVYLRQEERERQGPTHVVGQSPAIQRVLKQVHQVAPTDATVLLRGETGTGKELFAAYIHDLGPRHTRPMVAVNCAAIPATLIESELFGREKGAFTGALARQLGRFELANHSTIFLDEIGDLPHDSQVKLLRVLEERTIERLGNPRPIAIDTRIIAATHRNLEQLTAEGTFREDLYYRLNVFPIDVPPLRERVEDIPLLLWRFVEEFSKAFGKRIDSIDKNSVAAAQQYAWPGNIRELRNVVERAMIVATSRHLTITLPTSPTPASRPGRKLVDVEKEHIAAVLENTGWRIRGAGGAAEQLGLKPTTLETRIAKLGLKRQARR